MKNGSSWQTFPEITRGPGFWPSVSAADFLVDSFQIHRKIHEKIHDFQVNFLTKIHSGKFLPWLFAAFDLKSSVPQGKSWATRLLKVLKKSEKFWNILNRFCPFSCRPFVFLDWIASNFFNRLMWMLLDLATAEGQMTSTTHKTHYEDHALRIGLRNSEWKLHPRLHLRETRTFSRNYVRNW